MNHIILIHGDVSSFLTSPFVKFRILDFDAIWSSPDFSSFLVGQNHFCYVNWKCIHFNSSFPCPKVLQISLKLSSFFLLIISLNIFTSNKLINSNLTKFVNQYFCFNLYWYFNIPNVMISFYWTCFKLTELVCQKKELFGSFVIMLIIH